MSEDAAPYFVDPPPRCSCPTKFDEHSRAIVRAGLDQACPQHGTKKQELPHCASCTCALMKRVRAMPENLQRDPVDLEPLF